VVLHRCGNDFYFLIVCTWRNSNELWQTVFYKDGDGMVDFAPFPREGAHKPTLCVWELVPVIHEQQTWVRFLGSTRGLTPNLDALARQSAVFMHAYAQAPLTSVSHASILTGTYPQFHQVLDFPMPLAKDLPYAPDILHAQGYQTAAFLASMALDPTGGAPGFAVFYRADRIRTSNERRRRPTARRRAADRPSRRSACRSAFRVARCARCAGQGPVHATGAARPGWPFPPRRCAGRVAQWRIAATGSNASGGCARTNCSSG
jgi:hypothetical protein